MFVVAESPPSLNHKLSEDREQVLQSIAFHEILHGLSPSWEEQGRA